MINRFQVYPEHCNPITIAGIPMVHGGQIAMAADRNAALLVKELLKGKLLKGLTVGYTDCQYFRGALLGETITVTSKLHDLGTSRITIYIKMEDEDNKKIFSGLFSFCSFKTDESGALLLKNDLPILTPHDLRMTDARS